MISFAKGMVMSCICVWGCCLTGIILSHWDWWFFFVGVVSYARAVLIFYRHEFRTDMKALLKIFGHKFDDKQKILLQAASGIVLPSMLSLSEIKDEIQHYFKFSPKYLILRC